MRTIAFILSLVFIFIIPWEGIELPNLGAVAKFVGFVVAAFWLVTILLTGQLRKIGPFHIALALFVLWNALGVFWSKDPNRTIAHALTWVQLFVFVLILWDLYTTRTAIVAGLQAYVLGAYVAFGSAVANYFSGVTFYANYERFSSGDTNPDGFAFILALGMPVAWHLAGLKGTTKLSSMLKLVNYTYILAALLGITLSGTRTALIATIPAMAFGLASLTRLQLWARGVIFLLLFLAILVLLPYVQTLKSFERFSTTATEITEGDLNGRTNNWREGLAVFAEQPLIGVGSNMYRTVNSLGKLAHNSYLSVLVEGGLIGFVLFALILTIAVTQVLGQPEWDKAFWLSLLMVWAIGAFTLTWEHRKSTWLFLGLIATSAALISHRSEAIPLVQRGRSIAQFVRQAQ